MKSLIERLSVRSGLTKLEVMALIFVITSITIGAGIHLFRSDSEELAPYPKEKSSFEMLQKEKSEVEKKLGKTSKSKSAKSKTKKLTSGEKINVNSAGVDELMQIPGIGEKTAIDILALRIQLGGSFTNLNQLLSVKGVGEKKLANMKEYMVLIDE